MCIRDSLYNALHVGGSNRDVDRELCEFVIHTRELLDHKYATMLNNIYDIDDQPVLFHLDDPIMFNYIEDGILHIYGLDLQISDDLRLRIKERLNRYNEPHSVTLLGDDYKLSKKMVTMILKEVMPQVHHDNLCTVINKQLSYILNRKSQIKSCIKSQT